MFQTRAHRKHGRPATGQCLAQRAFGQTRIGERQDASSAFMATGRGRHVRRYRRRTISQAIQHAETAFTGDMEDPLDAVSN